MAVPPEVSSRSSEALFVLVLSVSQWPTRDFSLSKASTPLLCTAPAPTERKAIARIIKPRAFVHVFIFFSLLTCFCSSLRCRSCHSLSELLRREPHNRSEQHSRQHDVPEEA